MGAGTPKENHQAGVDVREIRFLLGVPKHDCLGIIRT